MNIWAISDLHLSFATPDKGMEKFGKEWDKHYEKIAVNWNKVVSCEDIVLIPGDISWAMKLEKALFDLEWIDSLPGKKVILKGNHDYWWGSVAKLRKALPESIYALHNDSVVIDDCLFFGARLWDNPELVFGDIFDYTGNPIEIDTLGQQKLYAKEIERLKLSMATVDTNSKYKVKIGITHYPATSDKLIATVATQLFEDFGTDLVISGHLHNLKSKYVSENENNHFGMLNSVNYYLTSCDYLNFEPLLLKKM